jgi:hypothetical protein
MPPEQLGDLPRHDGAGRVYSFYGYKPRSEVPGTVIACWPCRGPTRVVRLHQMTEDGQLLVVYLSERPESRLGR